MVISHNIQALNTNRIANENINLHAKSTEKVSSGYKMNHVGDNPVGLAMSETMRRQIRGLNQGIENTKAAINFCQVADGALNEVTEMLQRINELAVKAENGTNLDLDRHYLQAEVNQLLTEIDRVADVTTFNEIPIFRGVEKEVIPVPGDSSVIEGDIPFTDFSIADVDLGQSPFGPDSYGNRLNLQAIVNNPNSPVNGQTYDLIFGSGDTSYPSFRLSYKNAENEDIIKFVQLNTLRAVDYQTGVDANGHSQWQRSFEYSYNNEINIRIIQQITAIVPEDPAQEKKYNISYSFANNSNVDVTLDFMFNADTAYNNIDRCEGYFINDGSNNGSRLDKWCMFTNGENWSGSDSIVPETANENIYQNLPNSFSIIDVDSALAFSEKISFVPGSEPNALSIGPYLSVDKWSYYGNYNNDDNYHSHLINTLGNSAIRKDIAFSLFWNQKIDSNASSQISFNYGIISYKNDNNLSNVTINKNPNIIGEQQISHYDQKSLWIQTGSEKGSGLWLEIDEMNTEVLEIAKIDLTTIEGAADANIRVKEALHKLAVGRSKIGAQQNRLEHTVTNEENIVEKVTASESLIRDTDLSAEMVRYSNLSVLLQMGQNMIAQADQRVEKILTILQ